MPYDLNKNNLQLTLSGLAATFVGNGIGRFAFITLFPALIQQNWFTYTQAAYLSAATLLGYLIGVPLCHVLTSKLSARYILRFSMLLGSVSYIVCAWPSAGFYWFFLWRIITGICGAILMVLAPSNVLRSLTMEKRTLASGIIFSGVGLGAMVAGIFVPVLLLCSLKTAWLVLGFTCLLLTIFTWNQWEDLEIVNQSMSNQYDHRLQILLLLIAYIFNAVSYLPHTLFWVDYITRDLHLSLAMGGFFWAIFGFGAVIGPMITAIIANKKGLLNTLLFSFLLKAIGVALPLISNTIISLFISSILVGIFTPGVVTIVSSYTLKIAGINSFQKTWGNMTFAFAASQSLMGFIMVVIMLHYPHYQILFMISSISLLISCGCVLLLMLEHKIAQKKILFI